MNKTELVNDLVARTDLQKKDVSAMVDAFFESVIATLKKGEEVTIVGFGSWKVSTRQARTGRNPKTGAAIKIASRKVARFTAGKALRDSVA